MSWIADWVKQTLADVEPTDDPVRQDLEARVEAVAAEREAQQLFSTFDDDGIYADVAADLLRELDRYLRTIDDSSDVVSRTFRGAGIDGSSRAVPFDVMTRAMREALKEIGRTTTKSRFNSAMQPAFKSTRSGSNRFEKWWIGTVLPALHDQFVTNVNQRLGEFGHNLPYTLTLHEITRGSAGKSGQSGETTMADIWVELHAHFPGDGEPVSIKNPVNLKCIKDGYVRCNSGGAKMITWAMLGTEKNCRKVCFTRTEINKALDDHALAAAGQLELDLTTVRSNTDYFFLVFEKKPKVKGTPTAPLGEVWVSSILTIDPDVGLYNNPAQSWPFIQVRFKPASETLTVLPTWDQARRRLWRWQVANERKMHLEAQCALGYGEVARGVELTGTPAAIAEMTAPYTLHPADVERYGLN